MTHQSIVFDQILTTGIKHCGNIGFRIGSVIQHSIVLKQAMSF